MADEEVKKKETRQRAKTLHTKTNAKKAAIKAYDDKYGLLLCSSAFCSDVERDLVTPLCVVSLTCPHSDVYLCLTSWLMFDHCLQGRSHSPGGTSL